MTKLSTILLWSAALAAVLAPHHSAIAQSSGTISQGPTVDIGGTQVGTFYESTPTGRTDDSGTPVTNQFGWPESSSAIGISIPFGAGSRSVAMLPENLRDPAFNQHVNLGLLGQAWEKMDPEMLTDAALQFVEAERILLRPHKSLSADDLLATAIRAAAQKKDGQSLKRLQSAAAKRENKELQAQIEAATKLAGETRSLGGMSLAVGEVTPEEYARLYKCLEAVERCHIIGDPSTIEPWEEVSAEQLGLRTEQAEHIKRIMREARSTDGNKMDEELKNTLDQLGTATRQHGADFGAGTIGTPQRDPEPIVDSEEDQADVPVMVSGPF